MNPEIERLEDILDDLINSAQRVLQGGWSLSDEYKQLIADEITWLTNRIQELYHEESPADALPPSAPPEVLSAEYPSSNINGFQYDPKTQNLVVKFQDKYPGQNGPIYSYEGVPSYIYDVFRRGAIAPKTSGKNSWHTWKKGVTPSHGAAMYALIKQGGFNYQRVS
jgi:hypothetical protein